MLHGETTKAGYGKDTGLEIDISSGSSVAVVLIKMREDGSVDAAFHSRVLDGDEEDYAIVTQAALGLLYVVQEEGIEGLMGLPDQAFMDELQKSFDAAEEPAEDDPMDLSKMTIKGSA